MLYILSGRFFLEYFHHIASYLLHQDLYQGAGTGAAPTAAVVREGFDIREQECDGSRGECGQTKCKVIWLPKAPSRFH
jgi:hypothetical protein